MEIVEIVKQSVSVAIRSVAADGRERVVAVLRPEVFGDPLGGLWGLPAASLREGETPDDAVARVLRDKLGLGTLDGIKPINEGRHDQDGYTQTMTVYAVTWDGEQPAPIELPAPHENATVTMYRDWRWAAPEELREAAERGSLCTRLYLEWVKVRAQG